MLEKQWDATQFVGCPLRRGIPFKRANIFEIFVEAGMIKAMDTSIEKDPQQLPRPLLRPVWAWEHVRFRIWALNRAHPRWLCCGATALASNNGTQSGLLRGFQPRNDCSLSQLRAVHFFGGHILVGEHPDFAVSLRNEFGGMTRT